MGLTRTVYVLDDQGRPHPFGPGQDLPEWAARQVTNPDVWEEPPAEAETPRTDAIPAAATRAEPGRWASPPPKAGPGSSQRVWAAYAASHSVDVADTASRDDIISACQQAGVPIDPAAETR